MAIADSFSQLTSSFNLSGVPVIITFFLFSLVVLIIIGISTWQIIKFFKFNKKIAVLEDVVGSDDLEPVYRDKAMLVKTGKGGIEILYLKKKKVYRGAYGKRMGKNTYYFAVGDDGYWYNVTLGSLNKGLRNINIKPTSVNMRYQNEALQEIIGQRYNEDSFLKKYGVYLVSLTFIAFLVVMSWFLFQSFMDTASASRGAVDAAAQVLEETKKVIGALDSLKASGGVRSG